MTPRLVVAQFAREEAIHLSGLVTQFADLLDDPSDTLPRDPAIARLVPDAYADDDGAAKEFRELTQRDLLERRAADAARVLAILLAAEEHPDPSGPDAVTPATITVQLDADDLQAWLRTLAAVRLVLASRLGIVDEDDHDEADPRFGIYEWLGYRLDGLVRAAEAID